MNKYILMQAPVNHGEYGYETTDCEYCTEIRIVDNSSHTGKKKVEKLINEGWSYVGSVETDLRVQQLKIGFEYVLRKRLDYAWDVVREVNKLLDEAF